MGKESVGQKFINVRAPSRQNQYHEMLNTDILNTIANIIGWFYRKVLLFPNGYETITDMKLWYVWEGLSESGLSTGKSSITSMIHLTFKKLFTLLFCY